MTTLALTLLVIISLSARASVKFIVWATYYIPVQDPDVREVSLPDVFIKWAQRSPDSFNSEKWYPGPDPDRKHTEGDLTWNWNTLEMPSEEKPIPPDIDFFQYKEAIKSFYQSKKFEVRITWGDKIVTAPVNISWDSLGPWNYQDNYWEDPNYPEPSKKRRLHASLKRGIPAAQAAKDSGYLGGKDEADRIITSEQGAGIDLSKTLADEIGFTGLDRVEVEFLWVDEEPPPPPFPDITDWPFIQRDPYHTGNNPYTTRIEEPMLGKEPLILIPNVYNFTQPVVSEGIICLCGDDGVVYAFDAESGVERWRYDTKGTTIVSPAISQSTVYVSQLQLY